MRNLFPNLLLGLTRDSSPPPLVQIRQQHHLLHSSISPLVLDMDVGTDNITENLLRPAQSLSS
jgi:hypothetical protein